MTLHFQNSIAAKIILGSCLFMIFNLPPSLAGIGEKGKQSEILVIGTGIVMDGNIAKGREAAISEALVKGVEEYLTQCLGSKGMINNFPRIVHDILPRAREGIENFHILAEERTDKLYKVLVRLKVNEKVMEERFRETGLILMEGPPIKVLFLVSQIRPRERELFYWWKDPESGSGLTLTELALHRVFQERGFRPINRLINLPEEDYSAEMRVLDLSDEFAVQWGRFFSADVVIHGKCEIMGDEQVSITLKALDIEKGSTIYEDSQTERIISGLGSRDQVIKSVEKAIGRIAIGLSPSIIRATEVPQVRINQLDIVIKGLRNYRQYKRFKDFLLKEVKGVQSVKQTKIKGNSIFISVVFSGDREKFFDTALNHESFPLLADLSQTDKGELIIDIR